MHHKNVIHFPRAAALAETTSRRQHGTITETDNKTLLPQKKVESLTRSFFELAGAHPFVFDALSFICTFHKEAISRKDNSQETHFRVVVPIDKFLDFSLDGHTEYRKILMTELYDMASIQRGKVLPYTLEQSILTVPLRVELIYNDKIIDPGLAKKLENLNGSAPVTSIALEFYKPLFASLLEGKNGESWFPLPKAFFARMLSSMNEIRDRPDIRNAQVTATPLTYRKLYLYMNLHDNGNGDFLYLDGLSASLSCIPGIVHTKKGKYYIDWWSGRLFLKKACSLFNYMADKGRMDGVKFAPTGIWYDKPIQKFRIRVARQKNYIGLPQLIDESAFAAYPEYPAIKILEAEKRKREGLEKNIIPYEKEEDL